MEIPENKRCSKCGLVKHLDQFYVDQSRRLGVGSRCKQCVAAKNGRSYRSMADRTREAEVRRAARRALKLLEPKKEKPAKTAWEIATEKQLGLLWNRTTNATLSGWDRKAATVVVGLRNRGESRVCNQRKRKVVSTWAAAARKQFNALRARTVEQAKVTQRFLVQLIEQQGYRCALSGVEITPDTAALDHAMPVSKGGEHVASNVAWVHQEINRMKGQLSVEEFVALCSKVVQYTR